MGRKQIRDDDEEYSWCAQRPEKLRFATIAHTSMMTGYTIRAIEKKIASGTWREAQMWKRSINGQIIIDLQAYVRWVEGRL